MKASCGRDVIVLITKSLLVALLSDMAVVSNLQGIVDPILERGWILAIVASTFAAIQGARIIATKLSDHYVCSLLSPTRGQDHQNSQWVILGSRFLRSSPQLPAAA